MINNDVLVIGVQQSDSVIHTSIETGLDLFSPLIRLLLRELPPLQERIPQLLVETGRVVAMPCAGEIFGNSTTCDISETDNYPSN